MDHIEVGKLWDQNAEVWTKLSRYGYNVLRDMLNSPAFMRLLGDVSGKAGLDIGCGEGHDTRLMAGRGAHMTGMDISRTFIGYAQKDEQQEPRGNHYHVASAVALPFADRSFDFVTACMSLMDVAEPQRAMSEAYRVVKPGGFFQFSITHPCFRTLPISWQRDETGRKIAFLCRDYFDQEHGQIEEWTFGMAPPEIKNTVAPFRIPRFHLTLSQ
jgi:ubiquinone/menaquinone biosynthesis C-methylase UbiE